MGSPAGMDIFQAAHAGDCARLAGLLEGGADVNAYDRWDSFPLYYACRAGHYKAARMLLEAGAIYAENTLEGERCYRGALNLNIRSLLQRYEGRPPPSPPPLAQFPAAFLSAFLASGIGAKSAPTDAAGAAPPDITLYVHGRPIEAHRVILAARSPYFRAKLTTEWRNLKKVTLPCSHTIPFEVMYSLFGFFYSDRLEVSADNMEALARVCRACDGEGLLEMANRLDARSLMPVVADLLLPHLDLDPVSPAQLCLWLTLSDMYDVPKVREHCLGVIARSFEAFAEAREFRALLLASRASAPTDGRGDLFHDLQKRWLRAATGGDESAALFDERLEMLVLAAQ
ncbi:unnamed protein product [Alopecurus aequalis]